MNEDLENKQKVVTLSRRALGATWATLMALGTLSPSRVFDFDFGGNTPKRSRAGSPRSQPALRLAARRMNKHPAHRRKADMRLRFARNRA